MRVGEPKKQSQEPIWRWFITIISIVLFIYLIYKQGWNEFYQILKSAKISLLFFGLFLLFISRFFVSLRWHILLKAIKRDIRFSDSLKITYAGLFASNFLPTSIGGDLVRYLGTIQAKVESALALASLIMDRAVGFAGMAVLLPGGIYYLKNPFTSQIFSPASLNSISLGFLFTWINKTFKKFIELIRKVIHDLFFWIKYPKNLFLSFFASLAHESFVFGTLWFFLKAIDEKVPFFVIASLYSLSYIVTLIPLSIGGLGIQEMSITYLFSHFGGVSIQGAIILATLTRMSYLLNSLPGAFFLPSIINVQHKKDKEKTSSTQRH